MIVISVGGLVVGLSTDMNIVIIYKKGHFYPNPNPKYFKSSETKALKMSLAAILRVFVLHIFLYASGKYGTFVVWSRQMHDAETQI